MPQSYRADHVGSLLRPPELLAAREAFSAGRLSADQLREAEDAAVLKALDLQRQVGIDVYSGGEYRRAAWSSIVRDAVDGLVPSETSPIAGLLGQWQGPHGPLATASMSFASVGGMVAGARLKLVRRLVGDDAAFLREHAPGPWKMTLPGALSVAGQLFKSGVTEPYYPTRRDLANEIAGMLESEIAALQADGAAYIQLDSLHYVERVADLTIRARMQAEGEDPEAYLDALIAIDNATLEHARQPGVTVGMHMCRGNNRSAWHAEGSYEPIAEKAFNLLNVDRFLLEYDTERAGGFEPLRFMPRDGSKMVVLGLISSKEPALESIDTLRRRIEEAARYVPLEYLAIAPQCGFASTQLGNLLTWDEQKRKLELVVETARAVWG
ncbi:MAG TPA: cobalamin-independent methionine synthase II family protein [Chloroflexota bacterium]